MVALARWCGGGYDEQRVRYDVVAASRRDGLGAYEGPRRHRTTRASSKFKAISVQWA